MTRALLQQALSFVEASGSFACNYPEAVNLARDIREYLAQPEPREPDFDTSHKLLNDRKPCTLSSWMDDSGKLRSITIVQDPGNPLQIYRDGVAVDLVERINTKAQPESCQVNADPFVWAISCALTGCDLDQPEQKPVGFVAVDQGESLIGGEILPMSEADQFYPECVKRVYLHPKGE